MQKLRFSHFSRRAFPVDQSFYGQTFVISSLTRCAKNHSNTVWVKSKNLGEGIEEGNRKIGREKLNTDVRFGYSSEKVGEFVAHAKEALSQGEIPVFVFHYQFMDRTTITELDKKLKEEKIRENAVLVGYYHVLADYSLNFARKDGEQHVKKVIAKSVRQFNVVSGVLDKMIVVSNAVKRSFEQLLLSGGAPLDGIPQNLFTVINNGIDRFIYSPAQEHEKREMRDTLALSPDIKKLVCFSGRIESIKGVDTLVKVIRAFENSDSPSDREVGFLIASGDIVNPSAEEKLKCLNELLTFRKLIAQGRLKLVLDVAKYVRGDERFVGVIEEIIDIFKSRNGVFQMPKEAYGGVVPFAAQKASDILIIPSISEANSLSLLEAASTGIYMLGSDVGGIPEIIGKGKGSVLEIGDSKGYVRMIRDFCPFDLELPLDISVKTDENMFKSFETEVYHNVVNDDEFNTSKKRGALAQRV